MKALTLALVFGFALLVPASAQGVLLADYIARISPQDQQSSSGVRHESAAAIVRQDRANFHRFDQADSEDEADDIFASAEQRAGIGRLMARGLTRPDVRRAIVNGTPLVRVRVYPTRIDVELVN